MVKESLAGKIDTQQTYSYMFDFGSNLLFEWNPRKIAEEGKNWLRKVERWKTKENMAKNSVRCEWSRERKAKLRDSRNIFSHLSTTENIIDNGELNFGPRQRILLWIYIYCRCHLIAAQLSGWGASLIPFPDSQPGLNQYEKRDRGEWE